MSKQAKKYQELLKNINFNEVSQEEFKELEYFVPSESFNSVIIVPLDEIHESGYRCMNYVLTLHNKIVGVVGGGDVLHLGYNNGKITFSDISLYRMDCLKKSGYTRIISDKELSCGDCFLSDLFIQQKDNYI